MANITYPASLANDTTADATAVMAFFNAITAQVNGNIEALNMANLTITGAKIANDTITAAQIAPNAITASELADGAVDTAAILDSAVVAAKLGTGAVTSAAILDAAIKRADLSTDFQTQRIAVGQVNAGAFATGTITWATAFANTNYTVAHSINTNSVLDGTRDLAVTFGTKTATQLPWQVKNTGSNNTQNSVVIDVLAVSD